MLIHSIDAGRRSGWAIGPAGEVPNQGYLILREPSDPREKGLGNMIAYLLDTWRRRKPDLVVYEAPLSIGAWAKNAQSRGFTGGDAIESGFELAGIIQAIAYQFEIPSQPIRRQSVLWAITGQGTWGVKTDPAEKKRKLSKDAVLRSLKLMKMIPQDCNDDDWADAVAMHVVASGKFARKQHANFGLFLST